MERPGDAARVTCPPFVRAAASRFSRSSSSSVFCRSTYRNTRHLQHSARAHPEVVRGRHPRASTCATFHARMGAYLELLALVSEIHYEDVQLFVANLQCLQFDFVVFNVLCQRFTLALQLVLLIRWQTGNTRRR